MGFQKGKPRPAKAGRKKGSLNKGTLAERACQKLGVDPFENMASMAANSAHPSNYDANKELCKYLEPQKRALDVAIDPEKNAIKIVIEDYTSKK